MDRLIDAVRREQREEVTIHGSACSTASRRVVKLEHRHRLVVGRHRPRSGTTGRLRDERADDPAITNVTAPSSTAGPGSRIERRRALREELDRGLVTDRGLVRRGEVDLEPRRGDRVLVGVRPQRHRRGQQRGGRGGGARTGTRTRTRTRTGGEAALAPRRQRAHDDQLLAVGGIAAARLEPRQHEVAPRAIDPVAAAHVQLLELLDQLAQVLVDLVRVEAGQPAQHVGQAVARARRIEPLLLAHELHRRVHVADLAPQRRDEHAERHRLAERQQVLLVLRVRGERAPHLLEIDREPARAEEPAQEPGRPRRHAQRAAPVERHRDLPRERLDQRQVRRGDRVARREADDPEPAELGAHDERHEQRALVVGHEAVVPHRAEGQVRLAVRGAADVAPPLGDLLRGGAVDARAA